MNIAKPLPSSICLEMKNGIKPLTMSTYLSSAENVMNTNTSSGTIHLMLPRQITLVLVKKTKRISTRFMESVGNLKRNLLLLPLKLYPPVTPSRS
jgi:hypothetical protein